MPPEDRRRSFSARFLLVFKDRSFYVVFFHRFWGIFLYLVGDVLCLWPEARSFFWDHKLGFKRQETHDS